MTVLLAAIIVIKSLNCVIGESLFNSSRTQSSGAAGATLDLAASPAGPLHSPAGEQGCTESGCLCKGFVAGPQVAVPEPSESLDDYFQLTATSHRNLPGLNFQPCQRRLCRPGGDLFADTSPAGRSLRLWLDSFTI